MGGVGFMGLGVPIGLGGFMGLGGVLIGLGVPIGLGVSLWGTTYGDPTSPTTPQIVSPIGNECHGRSCYGAGGGYGVGGPYRVGGLYGVAGSL